MDDSNATFSASEAVAAQEALRRALGLEPESYPLATFVGMIGAEIEQLRAAGRSDAEISQTIRGATGRNVSPSDLNAHDTPPAVRHLAGNGG